MYVKINNINEMLLFFGGRGRVVDLYLNFSCSKLFLKIGMRGLNQHDGDARVALNLQRNEQTAWESPRVNHREPALKYIL